MKKFLIGFLITVGGLIIFVFSLLTILNFLPSSTQDKIIAMINQARGKQPVSSIQGNSLNNKESISDGNGSSTKAIKINSINTNIDNSSTTVSQPNLDISDDEYIFPKSNIIKLGNPDMMDCYSIEKAKLARNEIFARKGYIFSDSSLRNYFETKKWYSPKSKDVVLNDVETYNVNFLIRFEKFLEAKYAGNAKAINDKPKSNPQTQPKGIIKEPIGEIQQEYWDGIYFRNENDGRLYKKDSNTGYLIKLSNDIVSNLSTDTLIVGSVDNQSVVYYINASDNYNLYRINIDGSGRVKIYDDRFLKISGFSNGIGYTRIGDGKTFTISFDGSYRNNY